MYLEGLKGGWLNRMSCKKNSATIEDYGFMAALSGILRLSSHDPCGQLQITAESGSKPNDAFMKEWGSEA